MFAVSTVFASSDTSRWQLGIVIALMIGGMIIGITYIVGMIMQTPMLSESAKIEAVQWGITAFIAITFIVFIVPFDEVIYRVAENVGFVAPLSGDTLEYSLATQQAAGEVINRNGGEIKNLTDSVEKRLQQLSEQSSFTGICNFWGVGFSVSFCSGLNGIQNGLMPVYHALNMVVGELYIFKMLIIEGGKIGLHTFLPIGLLLRCFSFTRKAGGIVITLGISLGIVLPLSVLFLDYIINDFYDTVLGTAPSQDLPYFYNSGFKACDERVTKWEQDIKEPMLNYSERDLMEKMAYAIVLRGVVLVVGALFIMLTFITSTAAMFGMPVDVQGLMRISM
jgi:hypothetical protein